MNDWRKALGSALEVTLEHLAYTLVEQMGEACADPPAKTCWARLELVSPMGGLLAVEMGEDLAARLLQLVTGGEIPHDGLLLDAVSELANTLAGRFLNRLLGGGTDFQLGLPLSGRGALPLSGLVWRHQIYQVEGHCFRISLSGEAFA